MARPAPDSPAPAGDGTPAAPAPDPAEARPAPLARFRIPIDIAVAVVAVVYTLPLLPAAAVGQPPIMLLVHVLLAAAIGAALPFRRRHPVAALAVMVIAMSAHALLGAPLLPIDVLALPALYSLAALYRPPVSVPGAAALLTWLLATTLPRLGDEHLNPGEVGLLCVVIAWVWTWGTLVRIRRAHLDELGARALRLEREQHALAEAAAAEERARIAREMHDIVSHSLSVVVVMSEGAAATVDTAPERAREAMLRVRDTGRSALADMRTMLGVLRSPETGPHDPQPGIDRLPELVAESRAAGLPVRLTVDGDHAALSTGLEATVYRIVQEALTNTRRHAGPEVGRVEVAVRTDPGSVRVRIADDGQGPATAPTTAAPASAPAGTSPAGTSAAGTSAAGNGFGLRGIRERVAASGGIVHAGPRPGGGFEVAAELPTDTRTEGERT